MELQRIGMKVFCREGSTIPLVDFIPVFHRWIQGGATDTLLIDVADYSHVTDGPGVLLAAHEGNFAVDETHGRRGLAYYQKTSQEGDIGRRLAVICKRLLSACAQLETEPELAGKLVFDTAEIEIFSNDRLLGPNTPETYSDFEPHVGTLLSRVYDGGDVSLVREPDTRERMTCFAKSGTGAESIAMLLARLGS